MAINSYPLIFKKRVCEYYNENKDSIKISEILKIFNVSVGTLYNWINKYKNNNLHEKVKYNKESKFTPEIKCFIRNYIMVYPNFDYKIIIKKVIQKYKIDISKSSLYSIIEKLNFTRKKFKKSIIPNKEQFKNKIKSFKEKISKVPLNKIISIDETSIDTHTTSEYGWCEKGTKIKKIYNRSRIKYTIISAINNKKVILNKIIKGTANAIDFKEFIEEVVKNIKSKHYLLMDNARIHHSNIFKEYIDKTNHEIIYNIPYSPEFNPIEMVFSKFKSIIAKKDNSVYEKIIKNIKYAFNKITKNNLEKFYEKSLIF